MSLHRLQLGDNQGNRVAPSLLFRGHGRRTCLTDPLRLALEEGGKQAAGDLQSEPWTTSRIASMSPGIGDDGDGVGGPVADQERGTELVPRQHVTGHDWIQFQRDTTLRLERRSTSRFEAKGVSFRVGLRWRAAEPALPTASELAQQSSTRVVVRPGGAGSHGSRASSSLPPD